MKQTKKYIELARIHHKNPGINSCHTVCVKTSNENFVYQHIFNGNDKQPPRIYNPFLETDEIASDNCNYFYNYLVKIIGLKPILMEGYLLGKQVQYKYIDRYQGEKLSSIPPLRLLFKY